MNDLCLIMNQLELECSNDFESLINSINEIGYIEEAAENKNVIKRLSEGVDAIFTKLKEKITEIVTSVTVKKKIKTAETKIKENPAIGNVKVSVPNQNEINKITSEALNAINKASNKRDIDDAVKKYKKQRNRLLTGTAFITVSLSSIIYFMNNGYKKQLKSMESQVTSAKRAITKYEASNAKLKNIIGKRNDIIRKKNEEIKDLTTKLNIEKEESKLKKMKLKTDAKVSSVKRSVDTIRDNANEAIDINRLRASSCLDVLKTASSDLIHSTTNMVKGLSSDGNPIQKVSGVINGVSDVKDTISSVTSGKAMKNSSEKKKSELSKELKHLHDNLEKARAVLRDSNASPERIKKAKDYISKYMPKYKSLKATYNNLI